MRDAIQTGIGTITMVSLALAVAPRVTVTPDPVVVEVPAAPTPALTFQQRAIELACARYGDAPCSFEVFSTVPHGDRIGVFVRRSTGVCGGCGALTVAVLFRGNELELVDQLGKYGRFGNGPEAIRFRDVVGHLVIEVDDTVSMGGYTETSREYFGIDSGRLDRQLCLMIEASDAGARDNASEWSAPVWIADEGTMYFVPSYTKRGAVTPQLYAFSFSLENGRWSRPEYGGSCIDPRAPE